MHVTPSFTVALKSSRSDLVPFFCWGGTPSSRKSPSFLQYSMLCSRFRVTEQCACPIVAITWFSLFLVSKQIVPCKWGVPEAPTSLPYTRYSVPSGRVDSLSKLAGV